MPADRVCVMPIAELQSEWIADLLEGRSSLPDAHEMRTEIGREQTRMKRRYVASKRHTIQVDFSPYMRELRRERRKRRGQGAAQALGRAGGPTSAAARERAEVG